MTRSSQIIALVLVVFMLVGCTSPAVPAPDPEVSRPDTDKATVVGRLMSEADGQPIADATVRLAEVYREGDSGAYVLDDALSPGTRSEQDGDFVFENVDAKEYVLVVGNEMGNYFVIPDASGKARVWETESEEVLDVGEIRIDPASITP